MKNDVIFYAIKTFNNLIFWQFAGFGFQYFAITTPGIVLEIVGIYGELDCNEYIGYSLGFLRFLHFPFNDQFNNG